MKVTLKDLTELMSNIDSAYVIEENSIELTDKLADLGLDSLDVVEIVMEIEVKHNILIPDDVYDSANTVGDLLDLLNRDLKD